MLIGIKQPTSLNMVNYIFGYGSLINLHSLEKSIGRLLDISEVIPADLKNYRRVWNLKEQLYSAALDRDVCGIFLNIEQDISHVINGIIFKVTDSEFEQLKRRERNYDVVEVSNSIVSEDLELTKKTISTFVASNPDVLQNNGKTNCYVMRNYVYLLESGCKTINDQFWENFKASTAAHEFDELDGAYSFL